MPSAESSGPGRSVAVVTGASSGIGAVFARELAASGYDLVLVARRRERLEKLSAELDRQFSIDAEVLAADLSADPDVEMVARRIEAETRLGLLVNNAGFGALGRFHESAPAVQMNMHRVHVLAAARLTHAALTRLVPLDRGGVINVSSVSAFLPGSASYNSTKAWMYSFTESLHLELRSAGSKVRVQVLCPGFTYTEFHDLLGLDRDKLAPSRKYWLSAESVVAESLEGFERGDWLVVPSWRYRLIVYFLKAVPRSLVRAIALRMSKARSEAVRAAR